MSHPVDHIKEFITLTPEVEQSLRQQIHKRLFRRGETVTSTGNMRNNAFFIQRGSARVFYLRDGKEYTFSFSFENEFVALPLFITSSTDYPAYIQFLEPSQVYILPHFHSDPDTVNPEQKEIKNALRESTAEILTFVTTMMIEQTRQLEERVILLQNASAVEKYRWLLQRYPKVVERATATQIASFLGITKETLYRIRGNKYSPAT